jgi:hypothetical protein
MIVIIKVKGMMRLEWSPQNRSIVGRHQTGRQAGTQASKQCRIVGNEWTQTSKEDCGHIAVRLNGYCEWFGKYRGFLIAHSFPQDVLLACVRIAI